MDDSDKDLSGGGFSDLGSDDTMDIVAYIVVILGIIFTYFDAWVGGIVVGIAVGFYFASEITERLKGLESYYREFGTVKSVILAGALLALLMVYPTFFVTAAAVGFITSLVKPKAKGIKPVARPPVDEDES